MLQKKIFFNIKHQITSD